MNLRRVEIPTVEQVFDLIGNEDYHLVHVSPEDYLLLAVFYGRFLNVSETSIILNEDNAFFVLGRPISPDPDAESRLVSIRSDRESEPATQASPDRGVDNTGEETP